MHKLTIKKFDESFSVCKVNEIDSTLLNSKFCFIGKTDEELSLVCLTEDVPGFTLERSDHWKIFRIEGVLDFSLIGILSKITTILAENKIGIFAVSTYNTDYILVKEEQYEKALHVLEAAGYLIV